MSSSNRSQPVPTPPASSPAELAARELIRRRTEPCIIIKRTEAETGATVRRTEVYGNRGRKVVYWDGREEWIEPTRPTHVVGQA